MPSFCSSPAIFELDGDDDPLEFSSAAELRDHLLSLGLREQQIDEAMEGVKAEPRKIRLKINCSANTRQPLPSLLHAAEGVGPQYGKSLVLGLERGYTCRGKTVWGFFWKCVAMLQSFEIGQGSTMIQPRGHHFPAPMNRKFAGGP